MEHDQHDQLADETWQDTIWLDLGYAAVCTLLTLAGLLAAPELAFRWLL